MISTEKTESEYQETDKTEGGKFTARFKHIQTGEESDEKITGTSISEKETDERLIGGVSNQLSPLEKIQKRNWESGTEVNKAKKSLLKAIQNIIIPIIIGVISVAVVIWLYKIDNLSGPISINSTKIQSLESKDIELNAKIKTQDDRFYDLFNEKNNSTKK